MQAANDIADRHRARHPVADRALHRRAAAGADDLPPAGTRRRAGSERRSHEGGGGRMTVDRPRRPDSARSSVERAKHPLACAAGAADRLRRVQPRSASLLFVVPARDGQRDAPPLRDLGDAITLPPLVRADARSTGIVVDRARWSLITALSVVPARTAAAGRRSGSAIVFALVLLFGFLAWADGGEHPSRSPGCSPARSRLARPAHLRRARRRALRARRRRQRRDRGSAARRRLLGRVVGHAHHEPLSPASSPRRSPACSSRSCSRRSRSSTWSTRSSSASC